MLPEHVLKLTAQMISTIDVRMASYSQKGHFVFGREIVSWAQQTPDQLARGRQHGRTERRLRGLVGRIDQIAMWGRGRGGGSIIANPACHQGATSRKALGVDL